MDYWPKGVNLFYWRKVVDNKKEQSKIGVRIFLDNKDDDKIDIKVTFINKVQDGKLGG